MRGTYYLIISICFCGDKNISRIDDNRKSKKRNFKKQLTPNIFLYVT